MEKTMGQNQTKLLVMTGLFAALGCVATMVPWEEPEAPADDAEAE